MLQPKSKQYRFWAYSPFPSEHPESNLGSLFLYTSQFPYLFCSFSWDLHFYVCFYFWHNTEQHFILDVSGFKGILLYLYLCVYFFSFRFSCYLLEVGEKKTCSKMNWNIYLNFNSAIFFLIASPFLKFQFGWYLFQDLK